LGAEVGPVWISSALTMVSAELFFERHLRDETLDKGEFAGS
jgi:hypothetical protein